MNELQLGFLYENIKYITVFGANDIIKEAMQVPSNAIEAVTVTSSPALTSEYVKLSGCVVRELPVVNAESIEYSDGMFYVTGTVKIDSVVHEVLIDDTGIHIDPAAEKIEEPEPQVAEVEEAPAELPEQTTEDKEEQEEQEEQDKERPQTDRFNPFARFAGLPAPTVGGIAFAAKGVRSTDTMKEWVVGGETNNTAGVYIGGSAYKPNEQKHFTPKPAKLEKPVEPKKEAPKPVESKKEEMPQFRRKPIQQESTVPRRPVRKDITYERPYNTSKMNRKQQEPAEKSPDEKLKSMGFMKREKRKDEIPKPEVAAPRTDNISISAEVQDVLKQVPVEMLGPIEQFSVRPIDEQMLKERGGLYCIDNRWYHMGRWFCIDIVDNATRHFYNKDTGLSIQIPIKECKEWLSQVS